MIEPWARRSPASRATVLAVWLRRFHDGHGRIFAIPCPICDSMVTDGQRHLQRRHPMEVAVA